MAKNTAVYFFEIKFKRVKHSLRAPQNEYLMPSFERRTALYNGRGYCSNNNRITYFNFRSKVFLKLARFRGNLHGT